MRKTTTATTITPFPRPDLLEAIREPVRAAIEAVIEEELEAALGAVRYARVPGRRGYRNGAQVRTVTTECGPQTLRLPRGRVRTADGGTTEWRSAVLPRYQRRTRRVDEAILGTYLAGANTRRIRKALQPMLGTAALSKSAISRVVQRLQAQFAAWRERDLSAAPYLYLYLDALRLPVRVARRVVKVPVLIALGVRPDGQKVVVALEVAGSEATAAWRGLVTGLAQRGLSVPRLVIVDGAPGLRRAVTDQWPAAAVQRCTRHKLVNLLAKAPKHCHPELRRDYAAITHAATPAAAHRAYAAFVRKWRLLAPAVVTSLEEAGADLLTFTRFPRSQWKSLRTTNQLERLNGEFRRRTKTQGAFRHEGAALVLLYGLLASGQIPMHRIAGWRALPPVDLAAYPQAA